MKIKYALSLICSTLLLGCSTSSGVKPGSNAQEFSKNLSGNGYNFIMVPPGEPTLFKIQNGGPDKDYGIRALRLIFEPFVDHCQSEGGELKPSDNARYKHRMPKQLICYKNNSISWVVDVNYLNYDIQGKYMDTDIVTTYRDGDSYRQKIAIIDKSREMIEKEKHLNLLILQNQFVHKASLNKNIGDKVCNEKNFFGYVENISKDNIKVAIVGKAINESLYFFFNGEGSKDETFHYKKVSNPQVWSKKNHWGKCTFDGNS